MKTRDMKYVNAVLVGLVLMVAIGCGGGQIGQSSTPRPTAPPTTQPPPNLTGIWTLTFAPNSVLGATVDSTDLVAASMITCEQAHVAASTACYTLSSNAIEWGGERICASNPVGVSPQVTSFIIGQSGTEITLAMHAQWWYVGASPAFDLTGNGLITGNGTVLAGTWNLVNSTPNCSLNSGVWNGTKD